MKKMLFSCFAVMAITASAGYDLFRSGYPPSVSKSSATGPEAVLTLKSLNSTASSGEALDSRIKTISQSAPLAVPFSSLPVACCITFR